MQNKGAIITFAVLFTLACLYHLSFSYVTWKIENDAEALAQKSGHPEEFSRAYLDALRMPLEINGETQVPGVYDLFLRDFTYEECKDREINLGLDLKGGMNVTLEVSVNDLIRVMSGQSEDEHFLKAINLAAQRQEQTQQNPVTLFGDAWKEIAPPGKSLARIFYSKDFEDRISVDATDEEVLEFIREEAESAVERTLIVIRTRIDQFGATQPYVGRIGNSNRILVELPGADEPKRIRQLLRRSANLEFWETYDNFNFENSSQQEEGVYFALEEANKVLADLLKLENVDEDDGETKEVDDPDSLGVQAAQPVKKDTGTGSSMAPTGDNDPVNPLLQGDPAAQLPTNNPDTTSQTLADAETEAEDGASEEDSPLWSIMQPSLTREEDGTLFPAKGPVVGYALIVDTGKVMEYLNRPEVRAVLPPRIKFYWTAEPYDDAKIAHMLIAIKSTLSGKPDLDGSVVTNARGTTDPITGQPEVSMSMNAKGAKTWKNMTRENIGKSVAIILDGYVYSYPTVQGEIPSGSTSISGSFTNKQVQDLSNVLKAGRLPAPARIVEEAVVGPSLGEEAISAGLKSFGFAIVLVLIYMVFYYSGAGSVSDIALIANIFFILGVLASLGAVLTLPGIAGIILTIGMSVDANVLIYERVREELTAGKGLRLAIADGYKNAYSSIIDANVTTLLTAVILFLFGSGPIQGFATTLIIGILTSLFSAIFITRLIYEWRLGKNTRISFATKLTEGAFKNMNIGFLKKRKLFYTISGIIILGGIASLVTNGLNYGVDFEGGRSYIVRFENEASVKEVREALGKEFADVPEVKTFSGFGDKNQFRVVTNYLVNDTASTADNQVETILLAGLSHVPDNNGEIMQSQKVAATIADDIKRDSYWATIFSIIIIFLYIVMRFRKWQFGLGAIVAVIHDVLIVLSMFSILYNVMPFSMEIDQAFIAAILTVVGYSLNDTVVVFDRIREYIGLHKKRELEQNVNDALNSTLSRTINTSFTTMMVLLVIFFFGGEVIKGFMFAMLIGVFVGTYSSLFIASPIMLDTYKLRRSRK